MRISANVAGHFKNIVTDRTGLTKAVKFYTSRSRSSARQGSKLMRLATNGRPGDQYAVRMADPIAGSDAAAGAIVNLI